jgi:hypothetical protein
MTSKGRNTMDPQKKKNLKGLMAKTAAARNERVKELHLDLPVPSWNGDLVMRFNVVDRDKIDELSAKSKRGSEDEIDLLVSNVQSLWVWGPEAALKAAEIDEAEMAKLERMVDNENYFKLVDDRGIEIKFDIQLLDYFYDPDNPDPTMVAVKENPTVKAILVDWLYAGNRVAIGESVGRLLTWSGNTDRKVSETIVPESRA